jgi:lipopolysaccharide/colanic/teichoic acid biosynthesis glycosyltransferase
MAFPGGDPVTTPVPGVLPVSGKEPFLQTTGALPSAMVASEHGTLLAIGHGPGLEALKRLIGDTPIGVIADDRARVPRHWEYLGRVDDLREILRRLHVAGVALCLDPSSVHRMAELANQAAAAGISVWLPQASTLDSASPPRDGVGAARLAKRALDIAGALMGMIVLSPILLATGVAIAVSDGFPVLFTQPRAGRHGRAFSIVKFRTMSHDADQMRPALRALNEISGGASFKLSNDPRVTRLGSVLRRLSLDELPQLWNVLRGEMSLVGPRPHPFDDVAGYEPWQYRRLSVKPGMTGLWQVELRGDSNFDNWVRKDLEYIDGWSLWRDLELIARTIPAVVRGTGR